VNLVDPDLRVDEFDYHLPPELIAQAPPVDRDGGRLLLVDRAAGSLTDLTIRDLPKLLHEHDLVVINNTRVIPARLRGKRDTGGQLELLLLGHLGPGRWEALAKPARKLPVGANFSVISHSGEVSIVGEIVQNRGEGEVVVQFDRTFDHRLDEFGSVPLPPYIRDQIADPERYQTVYAHVPGSAAAPTAGLHLSPLLMDELTGRGVQRTEVTLQIGLDTFRPVTVDRVTDHHIHREWCEVPTEAASAIETCRRNHSRVVAIGTTSARTLETWGRLDDTAKAGGWSGWTDVFITPGYEWTVVDGLLTNFHLPRSTLLMMITSFAGRDLAFAAYQHAVEQRYRFFSFGDAMLIV
jgi:S-adenosylmethionine:tRNA ribosyltransferase-isomerase